MKRLLQVLLLVTVIVGCVSQRPISIVTASAESTVELVVLVPGGFSNGVYRFQDVVGDHIVTCWVVNGYKLVAIECLELD